MKKEDKKAPMLDPKIKKEQDVDEPNKSKQPASTPDTSKKPKKNDPDKVPESNYPSGYGESGKVKKSPYKKKD